MDTKTFKKKFKRFWQDFLLSIGLQWVIAILVTAMIWGIYFTCRRKYVNYDYFKPYKKKPIVFTFWHGRMLMLSPVIFLNGRHSCVVASKHNGGRAMAKIQRMFGLGAIYGSSSEGALGVLRAGVRVLERGNYSICISPDGPSGPSMRVRDGAVYFAKMSGAPIIPVTFSASRVWRLNRWDKFMIPKPFSRIIYRFDKPLFVPRDATPEQAEEVRKQLEQTMVNQVRVLDSEFNLPETPQDLRAGEYKRAVRAAREAQRANKRKHI